VSERIDLGHGSYIEPEPEPREITEFHRTIVGTRPMPNTRSGNFVLLDCGHQVMTFGNLAHANGKVLCTVCRARAGK